MLGLNPELSNIVQLALPYLAIIVVLIIVILAISLFYAHTKKTKAARLKKKSEIIDKKIEHLQKDYFVRKKIPRPEFEEKYERYKNELIAISKKLREITIKRKDKHKKEAQAENA